MNLAGLVGLRAACLVVLLALQLASGSDVGRANRINVGIIFTKAAGNANLQQKFRLCVFSILKYARVDFDLYIIGDRESQNIARTIISRVKKVNVDFKVSLRRRR